MRVFVLLFALLSFNALESAAQNNTEGNNTAVTVAPTQSLSSKQLRKAEKVESSSEEALRNIDKKIEELEAHIKLSSENPEYDPNAAKARLSQLKKERTRIQQQPK